MAKVTIRVGAVARSPASHLTQVKIRIRKGVRGGATDSGHNRKVKETVCRGDKGPRLSSWEAVRAGGLVKALRVPQDYTSGLC